jgi:hypothetical protein
MCLRGELHCVWPDMLHLLCVFCTLYWVGCCVCFGPTNVNAYLCAHSLECFSELVFLFFAYIYLFVGEGYNGPIKKTNRGRGNRKWKKSEMEQVDHDLVNRLVFHLRIYFRYLLPIKRGMRFMLCIFRVMSDSSCLNNVTFRYSLPDSHFAMYIFIDETRKRFGVCFL